MQYRLPNKVRTQDGEVRRVGFELEFSGVTLEETAKALKEQLNGRVLSQTEAELELELPELGTFNIELDWDFLKRKAAKSDADNSAEQWLKPLSQAAHLLVPVEVVCPPIPVDQLDRLDTLVETLRSLGAQGTEESLIAAYGVHINPELPSLDAATLHDYMRAFCLLQWWLVDAHEVNPARKISPYIDLYPHEYLVALFEAVNPDMDTQFNLYLTHNPSRNRALDLLPLLSEIDEARVRRVVDDAKIKSRPTFHYRLPNCQIEKPDWSLAHSWNLWWIVETLAERRDDLDRLGAEFLDAQRPLLGVNRKDWVEHMDLWLKDQGLA
ncbi:hypothetical protein ADIMK_0133 [Marinobacterium lacunae]|uniref:Amidoligase enzyme n=1 Tax=Marinobacterium lacunae TaxID=1232683 RepID=A0A081G4A6_9GAMM|nr:amidoligase family protein [Marinobacterium lacunae]KEA65611.1 hypothetical protein ADIMK_0133 [Marinobacterium lacunae]